MQEPLDLPVGVSTLTPLWDLVPKEPAANVSWRIAMREKALADREFMVAMKQMAFRDVFFFFAAFCWVYEPRPYPRILPFIPWPHQLPAILAMDEHCGLRDVGIDKSRGEGATWMYLMILFRRWLRDPLFSCGLVSRNEAAVDSKDDPDSLMWKMDFQLKMLPCWMRPNYERNTTNHTLVNRDNGASVVGYSATGDVASGGRKTVFAMDELAKFPTGQDYAAMDSTQHVTNCRYIVSTYKGDAGAYYDCMKEENNVVKIVLDWKDNPTRNRLLYKVIHGKAVAVRPEEQAQISEYQEKTRLDFDKLQRRGFGGEGKVRSPWYDAQCLRPGATPRGIAQELDRNPHGTVAKVFDGEVLEKMVRTVCRQPVRQGRFVWSMEQAAPLGFIDAEAGDTKLWLPVGLSNELPNGMFVVGADIAAGTGGDFSSNSAACVINRLTGEQVCEYASNRISPARFARCCVALARWFNDAYLVWEANGSTGAAFTKELVDETNYVNLYYRENAIEGLHGKTRHPGFWVTSDDAKLKIFESLSLAMDSGDFIPRSRLMIDECRQYQWQRGKIIHLASERSDDEANKGKAHGDRVIAAAIAWVGVKDQPRERLKYGSDVGRARIPVGSMAWRLQQHDARMGDEGDPWAGDILDTIGRRGVMSVRDEWM